MQVSNITDKHIAEYINLDYETLTDDEKAELNTLLTVAKAFICSYTGLKLEAIDTKKEFTIVVYILCQDMYDNRTLYVDKNNLNKVVDTILGMHCINLL